MRTCPDCYSLVDDNAVFCDNCGYKLPPVEKKIEPTVKAETPLASQLAATPKEAESPSGACSACGYINMPGEMFCQNCGVQLAPVTSAPPLPPRPVSSAESRPEIPGTLAPESPVSTPPEMTQEEPVAEPAVLPVGVIREKPAAEQDVPAGGATGAGESLAEAQEEETAARLEEEPAPSASVQAPVLAGSAEIESEDSEDLGGVLAELPLEVAAGPVEQPVEEGQVELQTESPVEPGQIPAQEPGLSTPVSDERAKLAFTGIKGRLIVRTSGVEIPLPSGKNELSIGRSDLIRDIFPDIDLSGYGGEGSGVSRNHARLVLKEDQLFIEDLNSTNYTFVNRLRLQPGQPYLVSDGDEIRLGLLAMIYHSS